MAKLDPQIAAHLEWIGFVQPTGLVVSAPALVRAGAILPRDPEGQRLLRECVAERRFGQEDGLEPWLPDFRAFASSVLGWRFSPRGYAGTDGSPIPPELETPLHDAGELLRPDFAVRERDPRQDAPGWQLLVRVLGAGDDFDHVAGGAGRLEVSAHGRMERLLRQTGVPAGLLFNGRTLRLVSAPRGESSGWLDLRVADMVTTAGRPMVAALRLLLSETRLLSLPREKRLAALLDDSRKYQNEVSERLAEQVLHALYELVRGMQAAHDASGGALLRGPLAERPDDIYHALLTVILRLVFLLYAEERDLLPDDETFARHYSLAGLYERLREDAALHPDTMNQRYGAWAQLLVLFRLFHDGAAAGGLRLPRRHGVLFDPDRFPFLEGRGGAGARQLHDRIEPPLVPDGTVYRALDKLLLLDGQRISYRALDVEQIGSVYETMMGFRLETATGLSVAIKAQKKHGAPTAVDLELLAGEAGGRRAQWLRERTDRTLTATVRKPVAAAETVADLHAALQPVIDTAATPDLVPAGAMALQPSEARRRSGSHYTPRELTEPIVRTTLEPILARLRGPGGEPPTPEAILDLKICDPAMGSGAFLVETCRQLGDALIETWRIHEAAPELPAGEDEVIVARRLIAQRCIYGVDRNPMAVDLAKVSLWLATLAKEHALTFVDHALRHGDSLVGLSRRQLEAFHWDASKPPLLRGLGMRDALDAYAGLRRRIRAAHANISDWDLRDWWDQARFELAKVRLFGDLTIAAFFDGATPKEREAKNGGYARAVLNGEAEQYRGWLAERRRADSPLAPFHWEIEFPEVFERAPSTASARENPSQEKSPGFDAIVGNPPFLGGKRISTNLGDGYRDWLAALHAESSSNADLVAHFFRRAFELVRQQGAFGLIATNTVAQGDTRASGLRWICTHGGEIFSVRRRVMWPGLAAVVVSVLHIGKESVADRKHIDGRDVERITAFLFHRGGHDDPVRLKANAGKSFVGSYVLGMGFTFDDTDTKGVASPLAEMHRLIEEDPRNQEVVFPYIGGEEVNSSPTHAHHRYVINFQDYPLCRDRTKPSGAALYSEDEATAAESDQGAQQAASWARATNEEQRACLQRGRVPHDYPGPVAADWPELLAIVEERVKPERMKVKRQAHRLRWWHYGDKRPALYGAIAGLERVLAISQTSKTMAFTFLPARTVYSHKLIVFQYESYAAFSALQARPHEIWARFFGSTMKDDAVYTPSDCFDPFPFPNGCDTDPALEAAGKAYFEFRASLMVHNDEGLTTTYNRFHDPYENDLEIATLRELHAAMDRAVLDAYGWTDVPTACEFLLDYEIDEETWGNKKKPYRYRWPDAVRDEILARLLELNAERAAEELRAGRVHHNPAR